MRASPPSTVVPFHFLFYFILFYFLLPSISHLNSTHLISNKHNIHHLISQHKIHLILFTSQNSHPQYLHAQSSRDTQHKIYSQLTDSKIDSCLSHENNTTNMYNKNQTPSPGHRRHPWIRAATSWPAAPSRRPAPAGPRASRSPRPAHVELRGPSLRTRPSFRAGLAPRWGRPCAAATSTPLPPPSPPAERRGREVRWRKREARREREDKRDGREDKKSANFC
jgi:hypothetical protein